jgi:hypothetical protein
MGSNASSMLLLLTLVGCAAAEDRPIEVIGQAHSGSERFQGFATISKNGSTAVRMTNAVGVKCVGIFPYAGRAKSKGELICTDGRIAKMTFTALSRTSGHGYGTASDHTAIAFYFGLPEAEAEAYLGLPRTSQ